MSHFQMKLLICVNIVNLIDFVGLSYLKKETVIEGGLLFKIKKSHILHSHIVLMNLCTCGKYRQLISML